MEMALTFCLLLAAATVNQREELSLMGPKDVAYAEAMQFAQSLRQQGFTVQSIHRSKMESFFSGLPKAAFLRTDKGVIEVIFFDEPTGAEKVRVIEQRQGNRYLYAFEGQPHPQPGERIDAGHPTYFIPYRNWFMVVTDKELASALQQAFIR
jgi:hypothetical protein